MGQDAFHHGGVGRQHQVVLVHAHGVVALLLQHTHHTEGDAVESHHLAHGVAAVGEEIIHHCLSQDAHLGSRLDVVVGKHLTVGHLELSDAQVVLVHTVDGTLRIVVAVDPLTAAVDGRRDGRDVVALVLDSQIVSLFEGLHGRGVLSHTAPHVGTRRNHDHIASHLGDVGLDACLAALSDSEHGDDGSNTYNDTQSREKRPHLVGCDRPDGYLE